MSSRTHGRSKTREYNIWSKMVSRCTRKEDPAFPDYGGRGITVCDAWRSFEGFFADMGRAPNRNYSIDRRNNDGNYEPGNCRWATRSQQSRNRRDRRHVTFDGRTMPLVDWAAMLGIKIATLHDRLYKHGWSVERAFTTDPRAYHKR